jgi:hypothetical protein
MSQRIQKQSESVATLCLSPSLGGEIINWQKARLAFQTNPAKVNRDYYCKCCDELGQAISQWNARPFRFDHCHCRFHHRGCSIGA